ncbi:Symplekin [Operophtera brumata]|uniref:Symplekin n=1 Tax=Operophtera brumata TaxID=104452 RepID=A0A0L7L8P3_OPEBR|nr:Symplekin [Operophtera brumata]
MRSVLQALTLYPAMGALALNILQLLVEKEVWLNKVAWEGWIKCCERLLPASTFLLLSLPGEPLQGCVSLPRLHAALAHHPEPQYSAPPAPVPMPAVNQLAPVQLPGMNPVAPVQLPGMNPVAPVQLPGMNPVAPTSLSGMNPLEPLPPGME